jgi:hypothetical protein
MKKIKIKINLIITLLFTLLICLSINKQTFAIEKLTGAWFECEFSGKTSKPTDDCKMLDNDGFVFNDKIAMHISVVDSQETNCKKNKIGQCFDSKLKYIKIRKGRQDKVNFKHGKLILSFLGCGQVFHLKDKVNYIEASPDRKKCFWAGKKVFYLKKYDGELIFQK